jgi:signal transduction histidine kinase
MVGGEFPRLGDVQVRRVVKEQAALRRVAALVARGPEPAKTFWVVARELGRLLGADYASVVRFEPDHVSCSLAVWHDPRVPDVSCPLGERWPMAVDTAAMELCRTGRPVRRMLGSMGGELGAWFRAKGVEQVVACPVFVEGRLWGKVSVWFTDSRPAPDDTEAHIGRFVKLVASTIAQAEYRAELISARARLVNASDATRRRIERDLHDGAQSRLIGLGLELRRAEARAAEVDAELSGLISRTADRLSEVLVQLQEISRGLHPAMLTHEGLGPALRALVRRCGVPVDLRITGERPLSQPIEAALYYVASEALANVLKHAGASTVRINLSMDAQVVQLAIHDDGVGGASLRRGGSGLIGLTDRIGALHGTMELSSPIGRGTSLLVSIPGERR